MLEAGLDELCDALIFVAATRRVRAERAAARGWTAEDLKVREGFQRSLRLKRAAADFVVENDGSEGRTRAQVELLWKRLQPASKRLRSPAKKTR